MGISLDQFGGNTVLNAVYVSGDITAQVDTRYLVNTAGGSITVTLPSEPIKGDVIEVMDAIGNADNTSPVGFGNNAVVVMPTGGKTIKGINSNLLLDYDGTSLVLIYDGVSRWLIKQLTINTLAINDINDSDDVPEGPNNLYYTDLRVDTRLDELSLTALGDVNLLSELPEDLDCLVYDSNTNKWVPARPQPTSTDSIPEGENNLYYTDQRVITKLGASSLNIFSDINYLNPPINSLLVWNGFRWENKSSDLPVWNNSSFSNNLNDKEIPIFDGDNNSWYSNTLPNLASNELLLTDLKDVVTSSPVDSLTGDYILILNNSEWTVLDVTEIGDSLSISDISDVTTDSPAPYELIAFDGNKFVNLDINTIASSKLTLENVSNVPSSLTAKSILIGEVINGDNTWSYLNIEDLSNEINLTDLKDITESPKDKSILQYESGLGGWVYTNVNTIVGESIASTLDYSLISGFLTDQSINIFRDVNTSQEEDTVLLSKLGNRPSQPNRLISSQVNEDGNYLQITYNGAGLFVSRNPPAGNQQDSFTISLNKVPQNTVTVIINNPDNPDYLITPSSLSFSDDSPQTVNITSKQDNLGQSPKTQPIVIETTDSSSEEFRDISINIDIDIFDDYYTWESTPVKELPYNFTDLKDVQQIHDQQLVVAEQELTPTNKTTTVVDDLIITHPDPIVLTRGTNSETITVSLNTQPDYNTPRTVNVSSSLLGINQTLSFYYYNWEIEQTITISAPLNSNNTGNITLDTLSLSISVVEPEFNITTTPKDIKPYIINEFKPNTLLSWFIPDPVDTNFSNDLINSNVKLSYPDLEISHHPIEIKLQLLSPIVNTKIIYCYAGGVTDSIYFSPQDWNCPRYYSFWRDLENGNYKLSFYSSDPNDNFVQTLNFSVNKQLIELKEIQTIPFKRDDLLQTSFNSLVDGHVQVFEEEPRPLPFNNDISPPGSNLLIRTTNLESNLYVTLYGKDSNSNLTDTVKIKLKSDPTNTIRFNIVGYNLTVDKSFVEFTSSDWDQFQSFIVTSSGNEGEGILNINEDGGGDYIQLFYEVKKELGVWKNRDIATLVEDNQPQPNPDDGDGDLIGDVEVPPTDPDNPDEDIIVDDDDEDLDLALESYYPTDTSNISLTPLLLITFNKEIIANSTIRLEGNNQTEVFDLTTGESNFDGTSLIDDKTITLQPTPLVEDTLYSLHLDASAVIDNLDVGIQPQKVLEFTTFKSLSNNISNSSYATLLLSGSTKVNQQLQKNSTSNLIINASSSSSLNSSNNKQINSKAELLIGYRSSIQSVIADHALITITGESSVSLNKQVSNKNTNQQSTANIILGYKTNKLINKPKISEITIGFSSNKTTNIANTKSISNSSVSDINLTISSKRKTPVSSTASLVLSGETVTTTYNANNINKQINVQSKSVITVGYGSDKRIITPKVANLFIEGISNRSKDRVDNPNSIAGEVIQTTPDNNQNSVNVNSDINITYNKEISPSTGVIELLKEGNVIETFDVETLTGDNGGSLEFENNRLKVIPGIQLENSRSYSLEILPETIIDSDNLFTLSYTLNFNTIPLGNLLLNKPQGKITLTRGGKYNEETISLRLDAPPTSEVNITLTTEDSQITTSVSSISFTSSNYNNAQEVVIIAPTTNLSDDTNSSLAISSNSSDFRFDGLGINLPIKITPIKTEKKKIDLKELELFIQWAEDVNYTSPQNKDILVWDNDKFENRALKSEVLSEIGLDDLVTIEGTYLSKNDYVAVRISDNNWATRRFNINGFTTSDLPEGSRKYYTDSRVRDYIQNNISLGDLEGVSISSVTNNSILSYDLSNSRWVVKEIQLPETTDDLAEGVNNKYLSESNLSQYKANVLKDVNYGTPSENNLLAWDSSSEEWRPKALTSIPFTLNDLDNVKNVSATDNQVLSWNQTQGWWQPTNISSVINNLTTDDVSEATNKYYSTSLFLSDFSSKIIDTDIQELGNVSSGAVEDNYLVFDGSNWIPQQVEFTIKGFNENEIEVNKKVKDIEFKYEDGLYLTDLGDSIRISYRIPHWTTTGQLLTSTNSDTTVLEPGFPGQVLSINDSSELSWVSPRPAFLKIQTLSGDFTLTSSDHYSFLRINTSLTLTLPDTLIDGSYLWCRISSENTTLSFATQGDAVIVSEIPNVNELNTEVLLIYEGYNLQGEAEWSIRVTNGSSDIVVEGVLTKTTVQSSNFIATKYTSYPIDTSSNPVEVTLPSSPNDGDLIQFYDYSGSHPTSNSYPSGFGSNPLVINVGDPSHSINNSNSIKLETDNSTCTIQYDDTKQSWFITNGITDTTSIVVDTSSSDNTTNYDYYLDYLGSNCIFYNSFIHRRMSVNLNNFSGTGKKLSRLTESIKLIKATDSGIAFRGLDNSLSTDYLELEQSSLEEFSVVIRVEVIKDDNELEFLDVFGYRFGVHAGRFYNRHSSGKDIDVNLTSSYITLTVGPSETKLYLDSQVVFTATSINKLTTKDNCSIGALKLPKYQSIVLRDFGIYSKILSESEILSLI